jgi:chemotaxis protein CheX
MSATAQIDEKQLARIVIGLWSTVLDLDVHGADNAEDGLGTLPLLMARIRISGSVSADVHLVCPLPLLRLAASRMFALEPSTVSMRQLRDALAELTNLVAGAVKALLPGGCYLSLPVATDEFPPVSRDVHVTQVDLDCEGMAMQVLLIDDAGKVRPADGPPTSRGRPSSSR